MLSLSMKNFISKDTQSKKDIDIKKASFVARFNDLLQVL